MKTLPAYKAARGRRARASIEGRIRRTALRQLSKRGSWRRRLVILPRDDVPEQKLAAFVKGAKFSRQTMMIDASDERLELIRPVLLSILMIAAGLGIWQWQDRQDYSNPQVPVEKIAQQ